MELISVHLHLITHTDVRERNKNKKHNSSYPFIRLLSAAETNIDQPWTMDEQINIYNTINSIPKPHIQKGPDFQCHICLKNSDKKCYRCKNYVCNDHIDSEVFCSRCGDYLKQLNTAFDNL